MKKLSKLDIAILLILNSVTAALTVLSIALWWYTHNFNMVYPTVFFYLLWCVCYIGTYKEFRR